METLPMSRIALVTIAAALGLNACNRSTSAPTSSTSASAPAADGSGQPVSAPPIAALPLATATPVAASLAPATLSSTRSIRIENRPRFERYQYIDRAVEYNRGFDNTPPDYTVGYQQTRPWIWRANNGAYRIVERLPRGQRYYYYRAGSDQPFFVSDPQGGYGYENGRLVVVYGPNGAALDDAYAAGRADAAAAYYDRAGALYRAAQHDQRQAAYAADWQARRADEAARRAAYYEARAHDAEWQAWHDRHADNERHEWNDERNRRIAYAAGIAPVVAAAALIATRGHGHQNDGASQRSEPGRVAYSTAQTPQIQQAAATDKQRSQAVINSQRPAPAHQVASPAHALPPAEAPPRAASTDQRAEPKVPRASADALVRSKADVASEARRAAAVDAKRVAAATAVEHARSAAKKHRAAKQSAGNAAGVQANAAIGKRQREATDLTAHKRAKSAQEVQRVTAAADTAKAREAANAAKRRAGQAARVREDGAIQKNRAAKVGRTKTANTQHEQPVSTPKAAVAAEAKRHQDQAVTKAHKAAGKGKIDKARLR